MTEVHRHGGLWRAGLACLMVLLWPGARGAAADMRMAEHWIAMVETCVAIAETGLVPGGDGWLAAAREDELRLSRGAAAVVLRVGAADWVGRKYHGRDPVERSVGAFPAHVFCGSAPEAVQQTDDVDLAHRTWVLRARAAGWLAPAEGYVALAAGPYVGCGYDGRLYLIEFSMARPGRAVVRLNYPTRSVPAPGAVMNCSGVTS